MTRLDVALLDYRGQQSPPKWHAALVAIVRLRSGRPPARNPREADNRRFQVAGFWDGYEAALADIDEIIVRVIS